MSVWTLAGGGLLVILGLASAVVSLDWFRAAKKPQHADCVFDKRVNAWASAALSVGLLVYALNTLGALPPQVSDALPHLAAAAVDDGSRDLPGVVCIPSLRQD